MFEIQNPKNMTSSGENGLNIRTNAIPKLDRTRCPGRKRDLLTSRTRCNVLWKLSKFGYKVQIGNKVQVGDKFANLCTILLIEGVTVYGDVSECHAKRRRSYSVL